MLIRFEQQANETENIQQQQQNDINKSINKFQALLGQSMRFCFISSKI